MSEYIAASFCVLGDRQKIDGAIEETSTVPII
jgi:hypothetical protein